ncbi:hypothetical protein PI125_g15964 [Phytophthora idaei]|nr:hypothetical protein PI125_g15964 [Phytophthora idaei]
MDHDGLNGRRTEVQMCGTTKDISGDDRRDTGIRMPGAAGTRSPTKGPLVEDRRSRNGKRDR